MKKSLQFTAVLLLLIVTANAQSGPRVEINIGPVLADSDEYFSVNVQGNFYYMWQTSEKIDLGVTTGFSLFSGDRITEVFESIPDLYVPVAVAGRIAIAQSFSMGADLGYGINVEGGGGFYYRPVIAYNFSEKLALTASFSSIIESEYTTSAFNLGVNFGF